MLMLAANKADTQFMIETMTPHRLPQWCGKWPSAE
jgi:hypothetical protein